MNRCYYSFSEYANHERRIQLDDNKTDNFNEAEWKFFVTLLKEEARTAIWDVGAEADPEALVESVLPDLQELAPRLDGSDDRTDPQVWKQVRERLLKAAYATRPRCIRCGKCCTTGSPTLMQPDLKLLIDDVIKPQHIITIRKGETVYSCLTDELAPSKEEIVKIKEKPGRKTCVFYDEIGKGCSIYESRPLQCRTQECWNPDNYGKIAEVPRLGRRPILESTGLLWDIIQRHEARCSCDEFSRIMVRLGATKGQTIGDVLELLSFDHEVRNRVAERFGLAADTLDFFFGRSLRETISDFGLRVEQQPDGSFMVTPIEPGEPE
jgi:Fe-S-cluster containining protein